MQVHFTGACGRAIGSLALDLIRRGWKVTASDAMQYAPMDRILREGGIEIAKKFSPRNIPPGTEVVVCGYGIDKKNLERQAACRRGIPVMNMARFIEAHLIRPGRRIVIAGTNGKTTTTAMLTWILEQAGLRPDYLLAGLCPHLDSPARFRGRRWKVLEGDEFPAGVDDPRPKFLSYRPDILLITNLEFDHADVFPDLESIARHFRALAAGVPKTGRILVSDSSPAAMAATEGVRAPVETVGTSRHADSRLTRVRARFRGMSFVLDGQKFSLLLPGRMNVSNAAMAARAAAAAGVSLEDSAAALSEFVGVKGRLETLLDEPRATLVLDEGYHPASFEANIEALRGRYPGRRLVVALQPRYTGGRQGFQMEELPKVLAAADRVLLMGCFDPVEYPDGRFSSSLLARRLRERDTPVHILRSPSGLPRFISRVWQPGDVCLLSLMPGCDFITEPVVEKLRALVLAAAVGSR